jgi:SAM-dependent methyltransferase
VMNMINKEEYIDWKKWHSEGFGKTTSGSEFYFDQLFRRIKFDVTGKKTLEIGFGNGQLLNYLKERSCEVVGTEINPVLVSRAKEFGINAELGEVWAEPSINSEKFDLIVALDVIEHLQFESQVNLFKWVNLHLNENGIFLARFPEGASPFGMAYQHGDFTHISIITEGKIDALCAISGLIKTVYIDEHLKSDSLLRRGLFGKLLLIVLQGYATAIRAISYLLLFPLSGKLKLGTNSIFVAKNGMYKK